MSDKNKKGQSVTDLFAQYRERFPSDYQRILSIYEKEGRQRAIEEVFKKLSEQEFPTQPTGSGIEQLLKPNIAIPEATVTDRGKLEGIKVPTYSPEEIEQIKTQPKIPNYEDLLYQTQQDITDIDVEKIRKAKDFDVWDNIVLASKNVINTINETGLGIVEAGGLVLSKLVSEVDKNTGEDIFSVVRKVANGVRAYNKVKYNITNEDELIMNNSFDQQIVQGVTQAGLFMLGSGVGGAILGKAGQVIAGGLTATTEATQEATQAFDTTKNLDIAFNVFAADLPASALDYATDRFVFFKSLGTGNINKFLGFLVGTGIKGGVEGTTEYIQQYWQNITAKELYDYNRSILAGLDESFNVGSVVGMFLGGATTMTEMMLNRGDLTTEEKMLLESQRKQLYDVSAKLLSLNELERKVRQWENENLTIKIDPSSYQRVKEAIKKSERQTLEGIEIQERGIVVPPDFTDRMIIKGRNITEQAENTIQKASGIALQAVGRVLRGDDITKALGLEIPPQYKPLVQGIKELAKTGVGAGFLYWLSQTGLINDPTVIGALMIPMSRLRRSQLRKIVIDEFVTKEGIEAGFINPVDAGIDWDKFQNLKEDDSVPLKEILGDKLLQALNEIKESSGLDEYKLIKSSSFSDSYAVANPNTKTITIYHSAWDKGSMSDQERITDIIERLGEIYTEEEKAARLPMVESWLKSLSSENLAKVFTQTAFLHELQHIIDMLTPKLSTGAPGYNTWKYLPNSVLNQFVEDNISVINKLINKNAEITRDKLNKLFDFLKTVSAVGDTKLNKIFRFLKTVFDSGDIKFNKIFNQLDEIIDIAKSVTKSEDMYDKYSLGNEMAKDVMIKFFETFRKDIPLVDTSIIDINMILTGYEKDYFDKIQELKEAKNNYASESQLESIKTEINYLRSMIERGYDNIGKKLKEYFDSIFSQAVINTKSIQAVRKILNEKRGNSYGRELIIYFDIMGINKNKLPYEIYTQSLGEQRARTTEALYAEQLAGKAIGNEFLPAKQTAKIYQKGMPRTTAYVAKPEWYDTLSPEYDETSRKGFEISNQIIKQVRDKLEGLGYDLTLFDSNYNYVIASGGNTTLPSLFRADESQTSIPEMKKRDDRILLSTNLAKILTNEGIQVPPIGDIYAYLESTGRDIMPSPEDLPNIVNEIREFAKTREVKKDAAVLSQFVELTGSEGKVQEVNVNPKESWTKRLGTAPKINTPKLFFYPLFGLEPSYNSLEVKTTIPNKSVFTTHISPDNLYFVDNKWGLPVKTNPMNLDFDTPENIEASVKLIHQLGYKGIVFESSDTPTISLFEPIKVYNETDKVPEQVVKASEKLKTNLQKETGVKVSNVSTATIGDETTSIATIISDMDKIPNAIKQILQTGEDLNQEAVHIIAEGIKPDNVNYGEVLPDYSQWQPIITAKIPKISFGDASKINKIFEEEGLSNGAIISPVEETIYYIGGEQNDFTERASRAAEKLKREYEGSDVKITDAQLWNIGKPDSWGTVATYEEVKGNIPTQEDRTATSPIIDKAYSILPTPANLITGQWDESISVIKERLDEYIKNKSLSFEEASKAMGSVAFDNAIKNNTTVIDEINNLIKKDNALLPISRDAFSYSRKLADSYNPFITANEAKAINKILSEFYSNPSDINQRAGKLLITTNKDKAIEHGNSIYINLTRTTDVKADNIFLNEVETILKRDFGDIAVNRTLKDTKGETRADILEKVGLILSNGNPKYLIDNLALKHIGRTAATYNSSLSFIRKINDKVIEEPIGLSYNMEEIMKAKADNNPYIMLETLYGLNENDKIGNVNLSDNISIDELGIDNKGLLNIWQILTEGIVEPNKLLDISSIVGGLIKLTWNLVKAGFDGVKSLTLKLADFIGDKAKDIGELLFARIKKKMAQERSRLQSSVNLDRILPEYDARRLHRGVEEGATIGYKEENLAQPIRDNLDRIIEAMNSELAKDKRYRIPMEVAKKTALRLLEEGVVKAEDIDTFKRGTVMPTEYTIAYGILAGNNLSNSLEGMEQLKKQYGSVSDIPADIFNDAITNLQTDVARWAKVRAMISESARTVRLATEQFENYLDVLGDTLDRLGVGKDIIDLLKNREDKSDTSIDWLGLILYNFALSNPMSLLVNLLGNGFNFALNVLPEAVFHPSVFVDLYKSLPTMLVKSSDEIKNILTGAEKEVSKFYEMQNVRNESIIAGLWKLFLPTTWLSITDAVFRNYAKAYKLRRLGRVIEQNTTITDGVELLRALAERPDEVMNVLNPDEADLAMQALDYADYWAKYVTYALPPESKIGEAFVNLSKHPITRLLVLFAKVPMNILKQGVHHTPFYATKLLQEKISNKISGVPQTAIDKTIYEDRIRRIYVGTTLAAILMQGMVDGLLHITGDEPKDEFERELWAKQGFKPYHIYIKKGDRWVGRSYVIFEPLRMTINLYRGIYELYLDPKKYKYIQDDDIIAKTSFLMTELWNNINDASFMTGINEWYRTQESPKSASEYLERLITNLFIPNAFHFQKELPDEIREILNAKGKELYITENLWDRIKSKVGFGLQKDLTPRYDFFGDKIYNKFERFPFEVSETGKNPDNDLLEWLDKHGLVVQSYKKDPVIDSYGDYPALKERISQKIGKQLKERIRELKDGYSSLEEEYDRLKELARKRYKDDERVELFKTAGQILLDSKIQESITKIYTYTRNAVIAEELNLDVLEDLREKLNSVQEEMIPEIELSNYSDRILEIELQNQNNYIDKGKVEFPTYKETNKKEKKK